MFADNDRDAKAAYQRWLWQGPSGPFNSDLLKDWPQHDLELLDHLASFMYHEGEKLGRIHAGVERLGSFITGEAGK